VTGKKQFGDNFQLGKLQEFLELNKSNLIPKKIHEEVHRGGKVFPRERTVMVNPEEKEKFSLPYSRSTRKQIEKELIIAYNALLEKEKVVINDYQINGYKEINRSLRNKNIKLTAAPYTIGSLAYKIDVMDKAISKSILPFSITCFRAINVSFPKGTFVDRGFVSTSLNSRIQELEFDDYKTIAIKIPKGASALHVPDTVTESDEEEVIIPRNSIFKWVADQNGVPVYQWTGIMNE